MKKIPFLIIVGFIVLNLCGCIAVMATLAETAKAKETIGVSYSDALDIVKKVMKEEKIKFMGASIRRDIAEVKGMYTDDRVVRIFITKISDTQTGISVRVGTSQAGREDAVMILKSIVDMSKQQAQ